MAEVGKPPPAPSLSADPEASAHSSPQLQTRPSWKSQLLPTLRYLMRTDVHTFAFSVAANAILSFFPFVVLLMTLTRRVFHSQLMYNVVLQLLRDYLPAGQDFVIRNLNALVSARHRVQLFSLVILLITSTGVFVPLEVALNRVWGFPKNRSYLGNQLISLALAFACGCLALLSVFLTAGNQQLLQFMFLGHSGNFFLIYWLLPNGRVPVQAVLPAAVMIGLASEVLKYAYIVALPRLNFQEAYGPFSISVTLMIWAFLVGLLLLAGAYLSAFGQDSHLS
jgi:membrane protein